MPSTEITSMTASAFSFCSLTHTRTHLPQAYRNIWRYETAPHKMLSSAFAQFFQSCPYWFPPARSADPVLVPPRYVSFFNSSGTPSHHITIPLIFRDSPSAPPPPPPPPRKNPDSYSMFSGFGIRPVQPKLFAQVL